VKGVSLEEVSFYKSLLVNWINVSTWNVSL